MTTFGNSPRLSDGIGLAHRVCDTRANRRNHCKRAVLGTPGGRPVDEVLVAPWPENHAAADF
jgi:hypothetical protein